MWRRKSWETLAMGCPNTLSAPDRVLVVIKCADLYSLPNCVKDEILFSTSIHRLVFSNPRLRDRERHMDKSKTRNKDTDPVMLR